MAPYTKGSQFMASVGAGESRVCKTFNTESRHLAWEVPQRGPKGPSRACRSHLLGLEAGAGANSGGVPLPTVQAWMCHKVIQTTMRYAHVVGGQMNAAIEALDARSRTNA